MSIISAVYENGVFRPTEPLAFKDGETVSLIVAPASTNPEWEERIRNAKTIHEWIALANAYPGEDSDFDKLPALPSPTPEEQAFAERMRSAKSLAEMYAVMETAPSSDDDYDIVKMINDSRRLTGFRMPDPEPMDEGVR